MPLTNAQLQAAYRQRQKAKLARYEAALREIATGYAVDAPVIARDALGGVNEEKGS